MRLELEVAVQATCRARKHDAMRAESPGRRIGIERLQRTVVDELAQHGFREPRKLDELAHGQRFVRIESYGFGPLAIHSTPPVSRCARASKLDASASSFMSARCRSLSTVGTAICAIA